MTTQIVVWADHIVVESDVEVPLVGNRRVSQDMTFEEFNSLGKILFIDRLTPRKQGDKCGVELHLCAPKEKKKNVKKLEAGLLPPDLRSAEPADRVAQFRATSPAAQVEATAPAVQVRSVLSDVNSRAPPNSRFMGLYTTTRANLTYKIYEDNECYMLVPRDKKGGTQISKEKYRVIERFILDFPKPATFQDMCQHYRSVFVKDEKKETQFTIIFWAALVLAAFMTKVELEYMRKAGGKGFETIVSDPQRKKA